MKTRKPNKRKALQAVKRAEADADEARKRINPPGTRRVALIGHHNGTSAAMLSLLIGAHSMGKDVLK